MSELWFAIRNHIQGKAPRFDAEDLAQQTFARAAVSLRNNPNAYDGSKGEPLQWLRHIANHVIADAARTERRHPSVGGTGGDEEISQVRELHRWIEREPIVKPKPPTAEQYRLMSRAEYTYKFRRELANNGLPVEGDETALRRMLDVCKAQWRAGVRAYLARISKKDSKRSAIPRAANLE